MLHHMLRELHTKSSLRAYADSLPRGGITALAKDLELTTVYLSQLIARQDERVPSPELCVRIEQRTGVMRWDLRPDDWHLIWPELKKRKDSPKVHEGQGA